MAALTKKNIPVQNTHKWGEINKVQQKIKRKQRIEKYLNKNVGLFEKEEVINAEFAKQKVLWTNFKTGAMRRILKHTLCVKAGKLCLFVSLACKRPPLCLFAISEQKTGSMKRRCLRLALLHFCEISPLSYWDGFLGNKNFFEDLKKACYADFFLNKHVFLFSK